MKTGIVYDPIYLKHDTGQHPENYHRLEAIMAMLENTGLIIEITQVEARPASIYEIALVHEKQHINRVQEIALRGGGWLDPDTAMSSESYDAALVAAGGAIAAAEAVMNGEVNNVFALPRPPGHHAMPTHAMGFCLFNNIAVATKMVLLKYQLERIAIIDFDVHHGNGTQEAFYDSPNVLYISTHEYPFYPGTGSEQETGKGEGKGYTINVPLPAYSGDSVHLPVYQEIVVPAVRRFKPQLILSSAGYDGHWSDPLAMMKLSITGYARIVRIIKELTDELCEGRLVLTLEGGYNLNVLTSSVKATFDILMGKTDIEDPIGRTRDELDENRVADLMLRVKKLHSL
jgi:acetoin utilization deacetylase AcuC-like enzyme